MNNVSRISRSPLGGLRVRQSRLSCKRALNLNLCCASVIGTSTRDCGSQLQVLPAAFLVRLSNRSPAASTARQVTATGIRYASDDRRQRARERIDLRANQVAAPSGKSQQKLMSNSSKYKIGNDLGQCDIEWNDYNRRRNPVVSRPPLRSPNSATWG